MSISLLGKGSPSHVNSGKYDKSKNRIAPTEHKRAQKTERYSPNHRKALKSAEVNEDDAEISYSSSDREDRRRLARSDSDSSRSPLVSCYSCCPLSVNILP